MLVSASQCDCEKQMQVSEPKLGSCYYFHKQQHEYAQGAERGQILVGSGQGLQMPGALYEHYWELRRSHCLEPLLGLWLYCAPFHELPLWASYQHWEMSFSEAILQTRKWRRREEVAEMGLELQSKG